MHNMCKVKSSYSIPVQLVVDCHTKLQNYLTLYPINMHGKCSESTNDWLIYSSNVSSVFEFISAIYFFCGAIFISNLFSVCRGNRFVSNWKISAIHHVSCMHCIDTVALIRSLFTEKFSQKFTAFIKSTNVASIPAAKFLLLALGLDSIPKMLCSCIYT